MRGPWASRSASTLLSLLALFKLEMAQAEPSTSGMQGLITQPLPEVLTSEEAQVSFWGGGKISEEGSTFQPAALTMTIGMMQDAEMALSFGNGGTLSNLTSENDLRLLWKYRFLRSNSKFAVAGIVSAANLLGGLDIIPALAAAYSLRPMQFSLNAAYRLPVKSELDINRRAFVVGLALAAKFYRFDITAEGGAEFTESENYRAPRIFAGPGSRYRIGDFLHLSGGVYIISDNGVAEGRILVGLSFSTENWAAKDSDGDGVADVKDECPELSGIREGMENVQGCPQPIKIAVTPEAERSFTTPVPKFRMPIPIQRIPVEIMSMKEIAAPKSPPPAEAEEEDEEESRESTQPPQEPPEEPAQAPPKERTPPPEPPKESPPPQFPPTSKPSPPIMKREAPSLAPTPTPTPKLYLDVLTEEETLSKKLLFIEAFVAYFEPKSIELTAEAKRVLDQAVFVARREEGKILLLGYAAEEDDSDVQAAIADMRQYIAKSYLIYKLGFNRERIMEQKHSPDILELTTGLTEEEPRPKIIARKAAPLPSPLADRIELRLISKGDVVESIAIYFNKGEATLSSEAKETLAQIADISRKKGAKIIFWSFTSREESEMVEKAVSDIRSYNVKKFFINNLGIKEENISQQMIVEKLMTYETAEKQRKEGQRTVERLEEKRKRLIKKMLAKEKGKDIGHKYDDRLEIRIVKDE